MGILVDVIERGGLFMQGKFVHGHHVGIVDKRAVDRLQLLVLLVLLLLVRGFGYSAVILVIEASCYYLIPALCSH